MYNLSKVNFSNHRMWTVLEGEIALYEYTEYTGTSDSWLILNTILYTCLKFPF